MDPAMLVDKNLRFRLQITLEKWGGECGITATVFSTEDAERAAREIRNRVGFWEGNWKTGPFSDSSRHALANKIISQVDIHKNGNNVDTDAHYHDDCLIM